MKTKKKAQSKETRTDVRSKVELKVINNIKLSLQQNFNTEVKKNKGWKRFMRWKK